MNIKTTLKITIEEISNGYLVEDYNDKGVVGLIFFSNPASVRTYCEEILEKWRWDRLGIKDKFKGKNSVSKTKL